MNEAFSVPGAFAIDSFTLKIPKQYVTCWVCGTVLTILSFKFLPLVKVIIGLSLKTFSSCESFCKMGQCLKTTFCMLQVLGVYALQYIRGGLPLVFISFV